MSEMPSFLVQQIAFDEMVQALSDLSSAGDDCIYYISNRMGRWGQSQTWAVRPDGEFEMGRGRANSLGGPYGTFGLAESRLREACYVEGKGTWFSIVITVAPDGSATAAYNYDRDPEWEGSVEPTVYSQEQELYPRDLEHQPEWFRRRLAEGQVALEEWRRDPEGYIRRRQTP